MTAVSEPSVDLAQSIDLPDMVMGLAGQIGWLGALVICGLCWLIYQERKRLDAERGRSDEMTERLIQQTKDRLSEDVKREREMIRHIEAITSQMRDTTAVVREMAAYVQGRSG